MFECVIVVFCGVISLVRLSKLELAQREEWIRRLESGETKVVGISLNIRRSMLPPEFLKEKNVWKMVDWDLNRISGSSHSIYPISISLPCGCSVVYGSVSDLKEEQCKHSSWFLKCDVVFD